MAASESQPIFDALTGSPLGLRPRSARRSVSDLRPRVAQPTRVASRKPRFAHKSARNETLKSQAQAIQTAAPALRPAPLRPIRFRRQSRWAKVVSRLCVVVFMAAAAGLAYPFVPALQYQLSPHPSLLPAQYVAAHAVVPAGNRVIIPKIGVNTAILEGPSLDVLNQYDGVWHQTGDLATGNMVLAGHRFKYRPPNTSTLYNLDKVAIGDVIVVDWQGARHVYVVTKTMVVPATQISILNQTAAPQLTIYSCSDVRQTGRVVAVAAPIPDK